MAYLFWLEFVALYGRFKCVREEYSILYFENVNIF